MSTNNKQLPSTGLGPLASPTPRARVGAAISSRSMQQLLNQIDEIKIDIEARIRTLKQIDIGSKKVVANRDRSVEGRVQIKNLIEHIINLQKQMNVMTKESDPNWPTKTFDKSKQNALEILSNLSNQLNQLDKHLEKATGTIPTTIYANARPISTEDRNSKGIEAFSRPFPYDNSKKTASSTTDIRRTPSLSESDEETTSDEDDEEESENEEGDEYIVTDKKQKPQYTSRLTKKTEISSDESEEEQDDDDHMQTNYQLLNKLRDKKFIDDHLTDSNNSDHQLRTSSSSPPISRKPIIISTSTPLSRKTRSSPQQSIVIPITKEDDSYFEEEDDELTRLSDNTEQEEEEEESTVVNAYVQKLRMGKYFPGTQFRVIHNLKGLQIGDLTIHKDEILILIEQKPDDWWLFKNPQTQQQGLVPINHIQLHSRTYEQRLQPRINPAISSSTLVDVFKMNNYIPSGFIVSDLAPLTEYNRYKLSHTLIPKMTESNFAFADLHWRFDTDQIYIQEAHYQKILKIKKCSKIPKIKGEQIRVLNRCIRLCLYDGFEIISNIHSIRAEISNKINDHDLTENWYFAKNNDYTFIDEQSKFLIRSDEYHSSKNLYVLIELSQLCQSKISQEKCEVGCGWIMISLTDNYEKKTFNKRLQGGHFHQKNILLNSQYKTFHSNGLSGKIDRRKQARIRFSIESREIYFNLLYDNLPLKSMIIPINLIQILVFYRNELAYQYQKRSYSNSLSTKPIDSIFLSTFYQTLEQPDLIYILQRLYHRHKKLIQQKQREEFLKIYELSIYPLLFYRLLPSYNFHDRLIINQRRKLISEIISKQLKIKKNKQPDILAILLDPNLTNQWTPFTTDEICFSLQKYFYD